MDNQAAEDLKSAAGAIAGEYRRKVEQTWDDAQRKQTSLRRCELRDRAFRIGNEQAKSDLLLRTVKLGARFLMNKIFHRMLNT